jgi:putative intracellular protease/amidase
LAWPISPDPNVPEGIVLKNLTFVALLTLLPITGALAATPTNGEAPRSGMIKVAFVVSDHANVMDIAGPWEVFQDTMLHDAHGAEIMPFELYTVAPAKAPLHTTGSNRPGLTLTPDYSFADAPTPDLVVVGAQSGGPGLAEWLKKIHAQNKTIMSVCTGAFKLAEAGLLGGKQATTHHWYFGNMQNQFPDVKLVREVRYVQSDPITFTAGGLTSGVDLSLHIVASYFGQTVAQGTADYMEYQGTGWKSNQGISQMTTPITRQDWTGKLGADSQIVLHQVTEGASPTFTTDIPGQKVVGALTTAGNEGNKTRIVFHIPGHPATFTGEPNADGTTAIGMFVQDGKATPLTLTKSR